MSSFEENASKIENGGIDLSRLINKEYLLSLGDFYKCSICSKIMINPTDCESCGHSFCYECISKSKCPFGCEKKNLKPSSNGITNLLNNLKFKCINEGCDEIINYIDIKTHENICPFQKMICPNQQCGCHILKKNLEKHIKEECNYSLISCENCGYKFPRCQISEHEKMCSLAYQSFNSSSGNILNNVEINMNNNIDNKEDKNNKKDNHNFMKVLSDNIEKILDEKNIKNEINTNINIEQENDQLKKSNNNQIKENNNINNENIRGNIFNDNDNNETANDQNENINNNELSRLSLRQSTAQIEEDDLVEILKKAIEEKLNERFISFDSNIDKILKDIKMIKTFAFKGNNENNLNEKNDNKDVDNKINDIKEYLKKIINEAENEVNKSIKDLNDEINKELNDNKNNINKLNNENNNNGVNDVYKKIEDITNNIIENIKNSNNEINNINIKFKEDLNKIVNSLIENEQKNKEINEQNNINLIKEIENKLKNILANNNKGHNEQIIKTFDEKINMINNITQEIENKKNNELKSSLNNHYESMNKNINNINTELQSIKTNLKEISNTITEQFSSLLNNIKTNLIQVKKPVLNQNNQKNNINDFSFKAPEEKTELSPIKPKKMNSNENQIEVMPKPIFNERLKKKLQKNDKSEEDSNDSIILEEIKKEDLQENKDKIINILSGLESKLDLIDTYTKNVPNLIKDKIGNNLENNILEIGKKLTEEVEQKIDKMFSLKYCVECEKVDYFYAFMKCAICSKYNCKNCITICSECKKLICKKCSLCPICKNIFCLNCRFFCEICKNKFCKFCILKCALCNKKMCQECATRCKICKNLFCKNCSNDFFLYDKGLCKNCNSEKNIEDFNKNEIVENSISNNDEY